MNEDLAKQIATEALAFVRSHPGVPLDWATDALALGANLGLAHAVKLMKETREEVALARQKGNSPQ